MQRVEGPPPDPIVRVRPRAIPGFTVEAAIVFVAGAGHEAQEPAELVPEQEQAKQREQVQQLLQQQWRQVGVEVKINNKPAAVLFGDFYRMSKFETILIGMAMGSDPEHSFRIHSKYIPVKGGMGRNSVAYESADMDRALDAGVRDIDREKRKTAYYRAQEIFADELPYLPIFHYVNIRGTRKGVEGFKPNSNMQEFSWNTNEWWIRKGLLPVR